MTHRLISNGERMVLVPRDRAAPLALSRSAAGQLHMKASITK
jgi:hypothetical protein